METTVALSFRDALGQWVQLSNIGKKPRTLKYHQEILELILRRWPGDSEAPAAAVTDQVLNQFLIRIGALSCSRFNAIIGALRSSLPIAATLKRRRVVLKDRALISKEDFARLLEELDKRPRSHGGLVVRFLAHTGLRINEARQLRWADVLENCILLPGTITKNGRPRLIPFIDGIRQVLDGLRRVAGDREMILPQAEVKRALARACKRAGLPRLSHHDFRHLFATRCIQSGVDLPTVARWLGHRDGGALLARLYYHLADEHSRRMAAKVEI